MKKILLFIVFALFFIQTNAQKSFLWSTIGSEKLSTLEKLKRDSNPTEFSVFALDLDALKTQLEQAPSQENYVGQSNVIVQFPLADGKLMSYRIYKSSTLHPDLAARYQDIKTYIGQGVEDPTATMTISTTIFGLHTMTISGESGTTYIDPYSKDLNHYMIYERSKLTTNKTFSCTELDAPGYEGRGLDLKSISQARATDSKYRTYRMAMACTIEYAAFHVTAANMGSGTLAQKKAAVLAAMTVTVNRLNTVYQKDMSLTFQLVSNNDLIINIDSDNFSNDTPGSLINESQTEIDNIIGTANYDIGHTVSTGGGGLAQRPSVCIGGKARGITGSTSPVGDPYDIDFVAHEVGHQFGGSHTFAGDTGNCAGTNRSASTAVEPGSGTTIMAYAGICAPQDVQPNSDAYFHAVSLAEMFAHITGSGNCVAGVANGNNTPVIPALTNYTIPNGTAFKLTAAGVTDANGDALTYCWEQNNASITSATPSATTTTGVNFRSLSPTTSPTRFFPSLSKVLLGNLSSTWEVIPTVGRTMAFRVTVRDNRTPNGGQTQSANTTLTFASGTPFAVTSQNTAGISWAVGSSQIINWNVGGTAVPATTNVNILLSTDGGVTFPIVLAAATLNDGTESITVPNNNSPNCRIMIEPTNNIYYAVNSNSFTIGTYIITNVCNTYSNTTSQPIADGPDPAAPVAGPTMTSIINVPINQTITDINVNVNVTHTWIRDLISKVVHPDGTTVILGNRICNGQQGYNITFNDGAPAIVCGAATGVTTGNFAPNLAGQLLSAFNTKPSNGNWSLLINDMFGVDTGDMNSWSVEVCYQSAVLSTDNFELADFSLAPNPNNGNFTVKFNSDSSNVINISVHDIQGRLILNNKYNNTGLFSQNLELNNAQAGVYLVTVADGEKKVVKRIVVQ